jgi:hypothetical protein
MPGGEARKLSGRITIGRAKRGKKVAVAPKALSNWVG